MIQHFCSRRGTVARLRAGPFGQYLDEFTRCLLEQGYSSRTIQMKLHAIEGFGDWLSVRRAQVHLFGEDDIREFIESVRTRRRVPDGCEAALIQLLFYLRDLNIAPKIPLPEESDDHRPIEKEFAEYLAKERGVGRAWIRYQVLVARHFLDEQLGKESLDCSILRAADVIEFTENNAPRYKLRSAQTMLSALRGFLRFLHLQGAIPSDLTGCIFRVARWRLADLPDYLEPHRVENLLQGIDRKSRSGLRDYAILLLLARLGLRGGEVAHLGLDDIDWESGSITVVGKSRRHNELPLPRDVGEAIVEYLRHGRTNHRSRRVFLRTVAPNGELKNSAAITSIVRKHLEAAGLRCSRKGSHVLRHSPATGMIRRGSTLDEIGSVLAHEFRSTTEICAKVALGALRELAQPWPGAKP